MTTPTLPGPAAGRGRGRPSIGKPVTSRLSEGDHTFALALGDGSDALGIRRAVKIVAAMGLSRAQELCRALESDSNVATSTRRKKQKPKEVPTDPIHEVHQEQTAHQDQQIDDLDLSLDEQESANEGVMRHGA